MILGTKDARQCVKKQDSGTGVRNNAGKGVQLQSNLISRRSRTRHHMCRIVRKMHSAAKQWSRSYSCVRWWKMTVEIRDIFTGRFQLPFLVLPGLFRSTYWLIRHILRSLLPSFSHPLSLQGVCTTHPSFTGLVGFKRVCYCVNISTKYKNLGEGPSSVLELHAYKHSHAQKEVKHDVTVVHS